MGTRGIQALDGSLWRAADAAQVAMGSTVAMAADRRVQVTAASAAGGAVVVGVGGAGAGLLMGSTLGAVVGILPALFTFGLSIPLGAMLGGGCGVVVGGAAGGTAGFTSAGAAGYGAYTKRKEIGSSIVTARAKLGRALDETKAAAISCADAVEVFVLRQIGAVRGKAWTLPGFARDRKKSKEIGSEKAEAAAVAAAGGAPVLGTSGATGAASAAARLLAGGAFLGAAVGAVLALLLALEPSSVQLYAVAGGGCGLAAGALGAAMLGLLRRAPPSSPRSCEGDGTPRCRRDRSVSFQRRQR